MSVSTIIDQATAVAAGAISDGLGHAVHAHREAVAVLAGLMDDADDNGVNYEAALGRALTAWLDVCAWQRLAGSEATNTDLVSADEP